MDMGLKIFFEELLAGRSAIPGPKIKTRLKASTQKRFPIWRKKFIVIHCCLGSVKLLLTGELLESINKFFEDFDELLIQPVFQTMLSEIARSIFEPGVNKATKYFTYGIFVCLILLLLALLFAVGFNIHLFLLFVLSLCLLLAIIW